jgi:hypothetical protein
MIITNKQKKQGMATIMMLLCFSTIFPVNFFKNNNGVDWKFIEVEEK